jgi:hypothetical protein
MKASNVTVQASIFKGMSTPNPQTPPSGDGGDRLRTVDFINSYRVRHRPKCRADCGWASRRAPRNNEITANFTQSN